MLKSTPCPTNLEVGSLPFFLQCDFIKVLSGIKQENNSSISWQFYNQNIHHHSQVLLAFLQDVSQFFLPLSNILLLVTTSHLSYCNQLLGSSLSCLSSPFSSASSTNSHLKAFAVQSRFLLMVIKSVLKVALSNFSTFMQGQHGTSTLPPTGVGSPHARTLCSSHYYSLFQ